MNQNNEISQRLCNVNDTCDSSTAVQYSSFMETLQRFSQAGSGERQKLILEAEQSFNEAVSVSAEVAYNLGKKDKMLIKNHNSDSKKKHQVNVVKVINILMDKSEKA